MAARKEERPITNKTSIQRLELSERLVEALLHDQLRTVGALKKALRDSTRSERVRRLILMYAGSRDESSVLFGLAERHQVMPSNTPPPAP